MSFSDKVALITGATGALGCEVTKAFLEAQVKVAVSYRTEKKLNELKNHLGRRSAELFYIEADVTNEASVQSMVEQVVKQLGRIDALVNLVGGFLGGIPVADFTEAQWQNMIDINFKSAFLCSKQVFPLMVQQKTGRIITIGSKGGLQGTAGMSVYAASKAALINFTQSLAAEGKPHNVTANVVVPSIIDTPENRQAMPKARFNDWVRPESLAEVILFLCSEKGKDINGAIIPVLARV
jgi:NAD(P)-dependent dehydrogenase (short-subunit alcohol dehydrogenase family)